MFYDRVSENLTLQTRRLDGVRQSQYLVADPDFYPNIPPADMVQDMVEPLVRAKLSAAERNFRSRVAQIASGQLVQSQSGKLRQICVPKAWQERVRQAVSDYQEMQRLVEEVSQLEWKRLQERKP